MFAQIVGAAGEMSLGWNCPVGRVKLTGSYWFEAPQTMLGSLRLLSTAWISESLVVDARLSDVNDPSS